MVCRLSLSIIFSTIVLVYFGIYSHKRPTQSKLQGRILKYTFEVDYMTGSPDGVENKGILSVNGMFPGPTIEGEVGDVLQILVKNRISDGQNTSIHWHGIEQRGTPFQDGTDMITQWPIRSGESRLYELKLEQWGTFWYHSHSGSQYTEGLFGPLIIRNRTATYPEIFITLSDYYHSRAHQNVAWYFSKENVGGETPYPDAVLLNGKGRYPCDFAAQQNLTCLAERQTRDVFHVSQGTILLRLINASSRTTFNFSIDHHTLTTVEADGIDVSPVEVDLAQIGPGQRYSFLISRSDITLESFLIRADAILYPSPGLGSVQLRCQNCTFPTVTAVLQYGKNTINKINKFVASSVEVFNYSEILPVPMEGQRYLNESSLLPFDRVPPANEADQVIILNARLDYNVHGRVGFTFNDTSFLVESLSEPPLYTVVKGGFLNESLPFVKIQYNSVIKLVINNYHDPHPFHLHGHSFWIVGKFPMRRDASGEPIGYDEKEDGHKANYENSCKRDTVLVPVDHVLIIVFIADNPGVWLFHCHIDWHSFGGMAFIFNEAPDIVRENFVLSDEQKFRS